jgi:hypothetical protein
VQQEVVTITSIATGKIHSSASCFCIVATAEFHFLMYFHVSSKLIEHSGHNRASGGVSSLNIKPCNSESVSHN